MSGWPDNVLRALARLDPGPPPRRPTPATDQAIAFYQEIGNAAYHKLRWVMSPEYAAQLDRENPRLPGADTSPVTTLFGMSMRLDPNAATIMLELR